VTAPWKFAAPRQKPSAQPHKKGSGEKQTAARRWFVPVGKPEQKCALSFRKKTGRERAIFADRSFLPPALQTTYPAQIPRSAGAKGRVRVLTPRRSPLTTFAAALTSR